MSLFDTIKGRSDASTAKAGPPSLGLINFPPKLFANDIPIYGEDFGIFRSVSGGAHFPRNLHFVLLCFADIVFAVDGLSQPSLPRVPQPSAIMDSC
jgi:hypothetical protein